jgi:hypothetical protein
MSYLDTQSIQQRNIETWLTLQATLDERRMRHVTRTDLEGTLWIECLGFNAYPNCTPMIRIGPDAGVALLQVWAKQWVPESYYADARRVLAQVSGQCTLGTIKYCAASGQILLETPISFIDSKLRPQDVLYTLRRMSHRIDLVMGELWDALIAGNG